MADEVLTIDELAHRTGMTARNIRAHQSRGLLPPPEVRGRTGYYGPDHVVRIELIKELQAEGFSLDLIRRLLETASGSGSEVLRFTRALREPFGSEEPEVMDAVDLANRFNSTDAQLLQRAMDLGLVRPMGDTLFEMTSPRLVRAGEELGKLGISLDEALEIFARIRRHADSVAKIFVGIFLEAVWKPFEEAGRPEERWGEVSDTLERLRPVANDALMAVFQLAMNSATEEAFGRELSRMSHAAERVADGGAGAVVEAQGLTKRFGPFTAADGVTFRIRRGEIFGLLGPNGAGKSTTFKMLCGLLTPTAGTARVAGADLYRAGGAARAKLGYMAQKFSLYGNLSVRQNLDFFAGVYGLSGRRKRDAVARLVGAFGLSPYLGVNAGDLPLGFKQRLALACAVLHDPPVLFLDEPTSGVDPLTRREFWAHINALVERGVTVLVTTHFLDEAEYCDRVALIYKGRVIAEGSPDDLKDRARAADLPEPTLEDAFVALVERFDAQGGAA
jgi:ABC-type multidrug transport system ATPase subunit/DNA-binding transcriptional MerR regulator